MATYKKDIKHETKDFWVLDVGARGYEVYRTGITHSIRVASIGHGNALDLGLARAIQEAERRQAELETTKIHANSPASRHRK